MELLDANNIMSGATEGDLDQARRVIAFHIWAHTASDALSVTDPDFCEWVNQGVYYPCYTEQDADDQLAEMAKQWDQMERDQRV